MGNVFKTTEKISNSLICLSCSSVAAQVNNLPKEGKTLVTIDSKMNGDEKVGNHPMEVYGQLEDNRQKEA